MKRILRSLFAMVAVMSLAFAAQAQMPDGSIAPNFTATDINGIEHDLYSYLDEGKTVILDFSATWCGPCWSYHVGGALETLWEERGPDGTNDVVIISLESDDDTTQEDLEGTGGNTQGDWITGVGYPIIDNAANISDAFEVGYYPTIYTVCPNRIITESGQISASAHEGFVDQCELPFDGSDGTIAAYLGATAACGDVDLVIDVMSIGGQDLVNPTIDWSTTDGQSGSYDYDGTIASWSVEQVTVGTATITDDLTVDFTVSGDDVADNNMFSQDLTRNPESTTHIRIEITTDCYPQETGWAIMDASDGSIVAEMATGAYADFPEQTIVEDVWVPVGCYNLIVTDSYGDGMSGIQWGCSIDGGVEAYDVDGESTLALISVGGTDEFEAITGGFDAVTTVGVNEEVSLSDAVAVYPNPFTNETNLNLNLSQAGDVRVNVYNTLGEIVIAEYFGGVNAGNFTTPISFSGVEAGIYMINVEINGESTTKRVTLTK